MLRKMRKSKGLERSFVARKLNINPHYFNRIENGQGAMPPERVKILSELYGVDEMTILNTWREKNERYIKKKNEIKVGVIINN